MEDSALSVVTPEQMKELDRKAIEEYGIPSIVLMENAGRSVAEVAFTMLEDPIEEQQVVIFVGRGNNGGDGMVIGRHLLNYKVPVQFILLVEEKDIKGDALINYQILKNMGANLQFVTDSASVVDGLSKFNLVIDALFGTGLSRNLEEPFTSIIKAINDSKKQILSVDIPSGLNGLNGEVMSAAIKADKTVTLALPKKGLFENQGPEFVGEVILGDISLPQKLISNI